MPKTFLIADTHFSHRNIIKHGGRPFASTDAMNGQMVANWNQAVGPEDKVIHLGDVSMWKPRELAVVASLNGQKYLVRGNHDEFPTDIYKAAGFIDVLGLYEFHLDAARQVVCTHIPLHPMELQPPTGRWSHNVHGHIHQQSVTRIVGGRCFLMGTVVGTKTEIDPRYLCVSVEHTDYRPLELSEVRTRLLNQ